MAPTQRWCSRRRDVRAGDAARHSRFAAARGRSVRNMRTGAMVSTAHAAGQLPDRRDECLPWRPNPSVRRSRATMPWTRVSWVPTAKTRISVVPNMPAVVTASGPPCIAAHATRSASPPMLRTMPKPWVTLLATSSASEQRGMGAADTRGIPGGTSPEDNVPPCIPALTAIRLRVAVRTSARVAFVRAGSYHGIAQPCRQRVRICLMHVNCSGARTPMMNSSRGDVGHEKRSHYGNGQ